MTNQEIIIVVGIITTLCGFIAGRASRNNFTVENKADEYVVDIDVYPRKQKLIIKRITPKNK